MFPRSRKLIFLPPNPDMRFAIFGDIHANLEALKAVLADAETHEVTHYVCLGDVVGYNANPQRVPRDRPQSRMPGGEGKPRRAGLDRRTISSASIRSRRRRSTGRGKQLTDEDKQWLRDLKMVRQVRDFTIVHATLDTPHKWGYVFNQLDAAASFNYQHTQLCFYGHTHAPRAYIRDGSVKSQLLDKLTIEPGKKYFINCGSVGQPRDGDWHAAYVLYYPDKQLVELRRLEYDIWTAQDKIVDAGLPQRLADRLALGK